MDNRLDQKNKTAKFRSSGHYQSLAEFRNDHNDENRELQREIFLVDMIVRFTMIFRKKKHDALTNYT